MSGMIALFFAAVGMIGMVIAIFCVLLLIRDICRK